ncbi:hypothetical protein SAMN04488128_10248 [Chitinophaga eiseniae]|uniref:Uncharacterized protein n=1 Tax=Chitinophaga eiseniae TaxID=634771 RepID=A0A1T4PXS9_9BACT|nr:hypothetical protein [Chitinophaga eiseniae]SJZ96136.1 hypothetical protein SAMN04488128_10248 [Chitinophaga eiseniae]
MADFTLRWANRSQSTQDWIISIPDSFTLPPDYVREAAVTINNNYTFQIAVSTEGGFAAANLTYNSASGNWTLQSVTPNEWRLSQGNGYVTVACLLNDVYVGGVAYTASKAVSETTSAKGGYPAYQLYQDNTGTVYCTPVKVKSHAVGAQWVKDCLAAHPGTSCDGKPWLSDDQEGVIWP